MTRTPRAYRSKHLAHHEVLFAFPHVHRMPHPTQPPRRPRWPACHKKSANPETRSRSTRKKFNIAVTPVTLQTHHATLRVGTGQNHITWATHAHTSHMPHDVHRSTTGATCVPGDTCLRMDVAAGEACLMRMHVRRGDDEGTTRGRANQHREAAEIESIGPLQGGSTAQNPSCIVYNRSHHIWCVERL